MQFEYEYPLFIVVEGVVAKGDSLTFNGLQYLDLSNGFKGVAVFTDKAGAEEFRDGNSPGHILFAIPDAETLLGVLTIVQREFDWLAFDPWRPGKNLQAVRIGEMLRPRT